MKVQEQDGIYKVLNPNIEVNTFEFKTFLRDCCIVINFKPNHRRTNEGVSCNYSPIYYIVNSNNKVAIKRLRSIITSDMLLDYPDIKQETGIWTLYTKEEKERYE